MLLFRLLLIFLSLLGILPILRQAIRKRDFNVWELVMFFSSFFFCIVPAMSGEDSYKWLGGFVFNDGNIAIYLFIVASYILGLKLINFIWRTKYARKNDIINITYYLKNYPDIICSKYVYILFSLVLIIGLTFYIPVRSIFIMAEEHGIDRVISYATRIYFSIFEYIFTLCYTLLFFLYFKIKSGDKHKKIIGFFILLFLVETIFLPRRVLLFYIITGFIILYSIKREILNLKFYLKSLLFLLFVWLIYFPFYNVMRVTSIRFDIIKPVESIANVIEDATSRWGEDSESAKESSEGRSLNLFYALYKLIENDRFPSYGKVYLSCMDVAVPKIINDSKGNGPEGEIERRSAIFFDQADSYLLYSYADFHIFGGLLCSMYICVAILIYKFIHVISNCLVKNSLMDILLISEFINLSWNVEGSIAGVYVYLFRMYIPIIIVFLFKLFIRKDIPLIKC